MPQHHAPGKAQPVFCHLTHFQSGAGKHPGFVRQGGSLHRRVCICSQESALIVFRPDVLDLGHLISIVAIVGIIAVPHQLGQVIQGEELFPQVPGFDDGDDMIQKLAGLAGVRQIFFLVCVLDVQRLLAAQENILLAVDHFLAAVLPRPPGIEIQHCAIA